MRCWKPGPQTPVRSCADPTSWPGRRSRISRIRHSVGVSRSVSPSPGPVARDRGRATDLVRGEIDQPLADHGLARLVVVGLAFVAAQHGTQPGEQFGHRERLGHVVVGADVQRADLVAGTGPAGQHDDRRVVPPAQFDDHLGAVDVGQAEVEDDRVRRVARGQRQRLPAGARGQHLVLPGPQVDPQRADQVGLVLDDENAVRVMQALGPRPGISRPGLRGELSHGRLSYLTLPTAGRGRCSG